MASGREDGEASRKMPILVKQFLFDITLHLAHFIHKFLYGQVRQNFNYGVAEPFYFTG